MKTKVTESKRVIVLITTFVLLITQLVNAQSLVLYATGSSSGSGPRISTATNVNTTTTSASLSRVNCTTLGSPCGSGMSNSGAGFTGGFSFASSGYVTFTVYPNTGYQLNVTTFTVNLRRTGTGPVTGIFYYSIDGGSTWVNNTAFTVPSPSGCITTTGSGAVSWDMPDFIGNCTNGVIFRIYGYSASGSAGNYQVYAASLNGTVTALSAPAVSINLTTGSNPSCAGDSLTFTATPTNGGSSPSYQWRVDGANVGTNSPTFKTASLTSGRVVSCVMTSSLACLTSNTATSSGIMVTINPIATANAGSPVTICAGDSISLAGSIGGAATSSKWTSSSGTFSDSTSLSSWYKPSITGGTVTLRLTTNDPTGPCPAATSTVVITVSPQAIVDAGSVQPICAGTSYVLSGSRSGSATSSIWSAPSGSFSDSSSLTPTYTPSITSGTVTLTLTSNDPSGPCPATGSSVVLTVNPAALVDAGLSQTICANDSISLTGSIGGSASSATWSASSGSFSNASSLTSMYKPSVDSGTILLTLTTNDPSGACPSVISSIPIVILPIAIVHAGISQVVCAGGTVLLAGSIEGGASSASWSASSGTFLDTNSLTSSYTPSISSGSVVLTLTSNDPSGPCNANSSTMTVTVSSPTSSITLADTSTNADTLTEACEVGGWTYYADPRDANKWLFAIDWGMLNASAKNAAKVSIHKLNHSIVSEATRGTGAKDAAYILKRYWNVNLGSTSLVDPVSIRFYYDSTEVSALLNERDVRIATLNSAGPYTYYPLPLVWFKTLGFQFTPDSIHDGNNFTFPSIDLTAAATDGFEGGVLYKQFNGITSFSGGSLGTGFSPWNGVALPISLLNFEVENQLNTSTLITWSTATEINNKLFIIERSLDGIHFQTIGSLQGKGNSTTLQNYQFIDKAPFMGQNYYRLQQVDFDGQTTYSDIKSTNFTRIASNITIFPNPVRESLQINISNMKEETEIKVYDLFGSLLLEKKLDTFELASNQDFILDVRKLAAGTYMVRIESSSQVSVSRIIIQ